MNRSITHNMHQYHSVNDEGQRTCEINREHTHKVDRIKEYSESMYKIKDMRRVIK